MATQEKDMSTDALVRDLEVAISVAMKSHKSKSEDESDIAAACAHSFLAAVVAEFVRSMVGDAERYRHLRDQLGMEGFWIAHGKFGEGCTGWHGEAADLAIDLARAGK
jgi:hypothetical protein